MLNDVSDVEHIYIAVGYTDLRRGIDGLRTLVEQTFSLDPYQNCLFLFCGRRTDRIKALLWEGLSEDFCYPHIFSFLLKMMGVQ